MGKAASFVYEESPALLAARVRLAELQSATYGRDQAVADARSAVARARKALTEIEILHLAGEATEEAVTEARQAVDKAKATLAQLVESPAHYDAAIATVSAREAVLESQSKAQGREKLKPLYRDAVREMIRCLEAARAANERLYELWENGARWTDSTDFPQYWRELRRPPGDPNQTKLERWLQEARACGFID